MVNDQSEKRKPKPVKGLWLVQLLEYVIGFALASAATRSESPLIPGLLSILVIANATTVKAPLSAFQLTNATVHKLLGLVLVVLALIAVIASDVDVTTRAVLVATAVAEGFVSVRFGYGIRKTST